MLYDYYSTQGNRDKATWAAINVVLAMSLQQRFQHDDTSRNERTMMTRCLNNTRSMITDLVTRKDDLKGLQALLGLSVFLMGSQEVELVPTLVASAVKLSQWLGLHRNLGADHLDHSEAKERQRVFWITYVLDRDTSLRTRGPCLIQAHDLDMRMPNVEVTADTVGILIGSDGRSWFDFFRCRVHLARIQGLVYDWVFSLPAERLSASEKYENMNRIATMLRDWRNAIPEEYKVDRLQTMDSRVAQPLASLYLTECFTLFKARAHTAFSNDLDAMKILTYCCSRWASGYVHLSGQHEIEAESIVLPDWQNLIASARVCGKLFRVSQDMNPQSAFWCAYISAMVILIANKMWISGHALYAGIGPDEDFIQESLQFIGKIGDKTGEDPFRRMHTAASELNSRAGLAARTTFNAPSLQINQWYSQGDVLALEEFEIQAGTVLDP
ncbi:hypothetical protein Daus18300_003792 [Diaporthe australafricana]|uniref:Xylanolytic transcriptional activator regulatory domain-containing protein n=1 Tax=Diaporthe australafricana TaxID=127596 RepID=A0ABR3XDQ9_9PEZI